MHRAPEQVTIRRLTWEVLSMLSFLCYLQVMMDILVSLLLCFREAREEEALLPEEGVERWGN